jgi:hypothetical protein
MRIPFARSTAGAAVLLGCACAASAAAQAPPCGEQDLATAPRVSFADGRISMLPPPGTTVFPAAETPRHELVVSGGMDATFITAWRSDWGADPAAAEQLAEYIALQHPHIRWLRRDTVEMNGARWLRFQYNYLLQGEHPIYGQHYATTFQGRGVHVEGSVPAHNEERIAHLQASAATLQVRDCTLPPSTAQALAAAVRLPAGMCRQGQVRIYPDPREPRRVETAAGRISLVPPEGFQARSIPPRPNAPTRTTLAFSNSAGAMISVMEGGALPPVDSVAEIMAASMARNIDEVIAQGVVEVRGTRWGRLEFIGNLNSRRVHSVHYMSPFQGRGVVVAFTSLADDLEARAQLAQSAASLELADCVLGPPR